MNEYVLLLNNVAESSPLPAASASVAFNAKVAQWIQDNGATADVIRTEASADASKVSMICTEDVARRVAESFAGAVGSVKMQKENVITIPDPLPKKTRRPGAEPA
jgi:hypothetical protein